MTDTPLAPEAPVPSSRVALVALVTGIIALLTGWIPFWGLFVGIAAITLSILALKKAAHPKFAVAGLITGLIGTIIGLVVTIALVATVGFGAVASDSAEELANEQKTERQMLIEGKKDFTKGETANFADTYEVTVNSIITDFTPAASDEPLEGKEFLFLNITVKNISNKPAFMGPTVFSLKENGTLINASGATAPEKIKNGELEPGQSVTGGLAFEIAPGAKDLKLVYETTVYDQMLQPQKLVYTLAF